MKYYYKSKMGELRGVAGFIVSFTVLTFKGYASDILFDNGALINIASVRGAKATACENVQNTVPASFALHNAYGEIRYSNNYGPCWWMMELPKPYAVSGFRIAFRDVIKSVGFRVKLSIDPLDKSGWDSLTPVFDFKGTPVPDGVTGRMIATCSFKSTKARFLRIEFYGHNGAETGGAGKDHPDLVFSNIQVWGPDNLPITPAISEAQSAWAGGRGFIDDVSTQSPRECPELVDDNDPGAKGFGNFHFTFWTKGSSADGKMIQADKPCRLVVMLKHRSNVEAVGFAGLVRERKDRPRDMKIYTSPHEIGESWTLQKELKDIEGGEYEEIAFDKPALAKRVRFDMERIWNPDIDSNMKAARGHIAELYVYGTPLPPDFSFTVKNDATAGGQIFDSKGQPVRTLFTVRQYKAGTHGVEWDGLNDEGKSMPPGEYEYRIVQNPAVYTTAGVIGNNARPSTINQNPSAIESVAVDAEGNAYTANMWEEQAQDFRKWSREDGCHIYNSLAGIRNGNPNGMPYGIAVDDKYIYCTTTAHAANSQQHIRRFNIADGKLAPFPACEKTNGHILFCEAPEKKIPQGTPEADAEAMSLPLRGLAVTADKLFVTDAFAGKIHSFIRSSGAPAGSFDVKLPHAIAVDPLGQLWVGHEHVKVTVFSKDGKSSTPVLKDLGHVRTLAFGPDSTLYIADSLANQIRIYRADAKAKTATFAKTFGQEAKLGDYAPDKFYKLSGVAIDPKGNLVVSQNLPISGARLTRFAPDGKVLWDQIGAEFCNVGNYSQERPDEIISQYFHRYKVDKKTGAWEFRGFVLDGDPKYINWQHGVMRIQKLGGKEFLFQSYGDGLQVFRREGEFYRPAAMFGYRNPMPDGRYWDTLPGEHNEKLKKYPTGFWSWHDANCNGKVEDEEVNWFKKPGEKFDLLHFGVNVDKDGNGLLCDHITNSVFEMPMTGLDAKGNPTYDFSKMRQVTAPHPAEKGKRLMSQPLMAVRAEDGSIYVHSRSDIYPVPSENSWMCGWILARYDKGGKMLWSTLLPEACAGMDIIPGGGIMLVSFKWKEKGCDIFHYSSDGLLIGIMQPSPEFLGNGGIPDNVASLAVSRDPKDKMLDLFVEDCVGNRFHWHRIDDSRLPVITSGKINLK
ncbi:MAG: hypothetical protein A2X45_00040 [Lentisphaerae bacterium GWF2_50_93]|nr:MAG: hypothetical protein A2X45_00040 [Lentisphaerae bacterium GWF2_50_93]